MKIVSVWFDMIGSVYYEASSVSNFSSYPYPYIEVTLILVNILYIDPNSWIITQDVN